MLSKCSSRAFLPVPLLIYRAQSLAKQLRKFGYNVQITPANRRQHKTRERNPEEVIFDGVLTFYVHFPKT